MISPIPITTGGFGTMSLTWTKHPLERTAAIKVLKYVYETFGVRFFNTADFYHYGPKYIDLELLRDFATEVKDPELVISIKGGHKQTATGFFPDGSKAHIDKTIDNIVEHFKDVPVRPKLLFEMSRVDPKVPYEDTVSYIYENVKAGKIDGISLTEVSAKTIEKIAPMVPVSVIEEEFSLFTSHTIENGVLAAASKYKIPMVAYSPLCRGLLTDYAVEHDDFLSTIREGDIRTRFDKFQPEVFAQNKPLLKKLYDFAHSKGASLESLALGYINKVSSAENFEGIPKVTRLIPIPSGSTTEKIDKNFKNIVQLSDSDFQAIVKILHETPPAGLRYNKQAEAFLSA